MEHQPLAALSDSRGRARLGIVVPVSNGNLEPDMVMLRPPGVSLHFSRAGGYDLDQVPNSDQMRAFALASLDQVLDDLRPLSPDLLLYGCTSATLAHGPAFDRAFAEEIERKLGAPAVTAAGAVAAALDDLGVRRYGFASPYVRQLGEEAIAFFAECGFEAVSNAHVGSDLDNSAMTALTPQEVFDLGCSADRPEAEALVISCTDIRAVEAIAALEQRLGKPVITSTQALIHSVIKRLGLAAGPSVPAGRLIDAGLVINAA